MLLIMPANTKNITFYKSNRVSFWLEICFTPAGKNFQFVHTVPVIFVFLDDKNSARGTAMYQLSV